MDGSPPTSTSRQPWRHEAPPTPTPLPAIDAKAFAADLDALHAELKADLGEADIAHFRRHDRAGRVISLIGYLMSGTLLWPVAAFFLGLGSLSRWIVAHHEEARTDSTPRHGEGCILEPRKVKFTHE